MGNSELYILTFIIASAWDIILRFLSENYEKIPTFLKYDFIKYLRPYFKEHTLLAALLFAGFIGATCQFIIIKFQKFPKNLSNYQLIIQFLGITFIIAALYGFLMKWSNLFPHIEDTYYKKLGTIRSMYHDGISGIIVQLSILCLLLINKNYFIFKLLIISY